MSLFAAWFTFEFSGFFTPPKSMHVGLTDLPVRVNERVNVCVHGGSRLE